MKIGIDASRALRETKTGTEWYSVEIILNLAKIDSKNQYILYSQTKPKPPLLNLPKNFTWRIMPFPRGWTLFRLSLEMKKNPPDVLFIPAHTLPLIAPKKSVVMIHDLGFMKNPSLYPLRQKIYHNFVIKRDIKKAKIILTPSQYTKNDLIKFLRIRENENNIKVIYHGFDQKLFRLAKNPKHPSNKLKPYLFYLGRLETKKNLVALIKAFSHLQDYKLHTTKLVLAGKPGHGYKNIKKEIDNLGNFKNNVIELGYVPNKDLPFWYSNASAFVMPCFLEGFGLPVIEAMACGCPVLAANNGSLPEIGSNAALYFDPKKPDDISQKIIEVLDNENLRQKMIKKGFVNIKRFSWEKCARETLKVLESA